MLAILLLLYGTAIAVAIAIAGLQFAQGATNYCNRPQHSRPRITEPTSLLWLWIHHQPLWYVTAISNTGFPARLLRTTEITTLQDVSDHCARLEIILTYLILHQLGC